MDERVEISDTQYIVKANGRGVIRCVSCGEPIEYMIVTEKQNHHCSTAHENRREAASRSRRELGCQANTPSYAQRLADGFGHDTWEDYDTWDD